MPNCSVMTCKNRSVIQTKMQTNISYHRFPNDLYLKKVWTKAAGRSADWVPKTNSAICSKHFEPFSFVQRKTGSRTYIRDRAVPTLNLPVHDSFEYVEVDEAERNMEAKGTAQEEFEGNEASSLNNTQAQQALCTILDVKTEETASKDEIIARQEYIIKRQNLLIAQLEKRHNKRAKRNEARKGTDERGRTRKKTAKTNSWRLNELS